MKLNVYVDFAKCCVTLHLPDLSGLAIHLSIEDAKRLQQLLQAELGVPADLKQGQRRRK